MIGGLFARADIIDGYIVDLVIMFQRTVNHDKRAVQSKQPFEQRMIMRQRREDYAIHLPIVGHFLHQAFVVHHFAEPQEHSVIAVTGYLANTR